MQWSRWQPAAPDHRASSQSEEHARTCQLSSDGTPVKISNCYSHDASHHVTNNSLSCYIYLFTCRTWSCMSPFAMALSVKRTVSRALSPIGELG